LGQASRIDGITPAALTLILAAIRCGPQLYDPAGHEAAE
jgi:tRNA U34 5-carboxymethylaminomethyl modifying enzyme MnmG/GidA